MQIFSQVTDSKLSIAVTFQTPVIEDTFLSETLYYFYNLVPCFLKINIFQNTAWSAYALEYYLWTWFDACLAIFSEAWFL